MDLKTTSNFLGIDDMKNYETVWKQLLSEFLGTFLYLALVLSAGAFRHNPNSEQRFTEELLVALANGLVIASIVQIFGHVSGAHVNPAVTVGAMVCGHIKPLKAVCYIVMHAIGSIAGSYVAYLASPHPGRNNLGATIPHGDSTESQAFALEFLMTFLLVAVVLSCIDRYRGPKGLGSTPLAIGVCITGCLCSCLPYTGSLNPARSFGPAVVMNKWDSHWVYWVAPILGGLVAGVVYDIVLKASIEIYETGQ